MKRDRKPIGRLILCGIFFLGMSIACLFITLVPNEGASHQGDFRAVYTPGKSIFSWDVMVFGLLGAGFILWGLYAHFFDPHNPR